jgi:hypothetical protein
MHDVAERTPYRALRADAEQRLGRGIQIRDEEAVVDDDERRGQPLENVIRTRCAACATRGVRGIGRAGQLAPVSG